MAEETNKSAKYADWSKEDLIKEIKVLKKRKKYGLVWENTKEDVVEQCKNELPALEEDLDRSIFQQNTKLNHILIEGDNYHSLSVLNYTHNGKIDLIYIDPPYNTGNKDFIFNDHYVDKEDSYRHSKWVSFMANRLRLAKNLLSRDGAIFISIDDDEQAQLKLLCDEIFGQDNFVANIIWQKKYTQSNDAKYFSDTHDFVVCYAKDIRKFKVGLLPRTEEQNDRYKNPDNDPLGPWMTQPLHAKSGRDREYSYTFENKVTWSPPPGTFPRFSHKRLELAEKEGRIWFGTNGTAVPRMKKYLTEMKEGVIPKTIWMYDEVGSNDEARRDLKKFLPDNSFDNPKPVRLVKRIVELASNNNSIILDFFAGSGTTAQSILELNKDIPESKRQFILCTNNENNNGSTQKIATDICYPRVKNVLSQRKNAGSLKYYKTKFIDKVVTDQDKRKFVLHLTEMLCLAEYCFDEVVFVANKYSIFESPNLVTGIVYDEEYIDEFKEKLKSIRKPIVIYVFSYDNTYDEDDFKDVFGLTKVKPIPSVILNVYEKIARQNARRINL
jgi:adenine-specific DNA-methyltransferase